MAVHHFGTSVDGSVFVEQVPGTPPADTSPTAAPQRPGRGLTLKVRNAATNANLPDIVTGDYGYWDYVTDDVPMILVSVDNFATSVTIRSKEALNAAVTANVDVPLALQTAGEAKALAQQAVAIAQQSVGNIESVNGQTGTVILTAASVGARPTGVNVPATEVSGLSVVATTGKYTDLSGLPAAGIPATEKGAANGVATLDGSGKVSTAQLPSGVASGVLEINQASDGTWPLRNSKTSDPNARVSWFQYSASSPLPPVGGGYFGNNDLLYKKVTG